MKLLDELYDDNQVALQKQIDGIEAQVIDNYKVALDDIQKEISELYRKYSSDGKLYWTEMNRYNRLKVLEEKIEEQLGTTLKGNDRYMEGEAGALFRDTYYRHAWAIDQDAGFAYSWGDLPTDAIESAVKSPLSKFADSKALATARQGTVNQIRNQITLSLVRGESYSKMSKRIGDVLGFNVNGKYIDKGAAYKSLRVARTEGQRLLVEGQQKAYDKAKDLGIDLEEVWDATLDKGTRPEHGRMDGKKRDEEGMFNSPDVGKVAGPLQSGIASFDIHCRCRVRAQVAGYPPEMRYTRGDGAIPWVNYEDWKKGLVSGKYKDIDADKAAEALSKLKGEIADAFSLKSIPADAMAAYKKYGPEKLFVIKGHGSAYSPGAHSITFDPKRLNPHVIRHEYGHAIDFHSTMVAESSKMGFISKAKQARKSISRTNPDKMKLVRQYVYDNKTDAALSDFFCSLTKGDISGNWGHDSGYYKNYSWRTAEMFANMFDLYCLQNNHWKWLEENFTEVTSAFKLILKEIS